MVWTHFLLIIESDEDCSKNYVSLPKQKSIKSIGGNSVNENRKVSDTKSIGKQTSIKSILCNETVDLNKINFNYAQENNESPEFGKNFEKKMSNNETDLIKQPTMKSINVHFKSK